LFNVPECCHEKPFGFIQIKIEDKITRVPVCVYHYDILVEDDNDMIEIFELERNESITNCVCR